MKHVFLVFVPAYLNPLVHFLTTHAMSNELVRGKHWAVEDGWQEEEDCLTATVLSGLLTRLEVVVLNRYARNFLSPHLCFSRSS